MRTVAVVRGLVALVLFVAASIAVAAPAQAATRTFYVNCFAGSDSFSGRSSTSPWRTIDKVNATPLLPGDTIKLRRGCTFSTRLVIRDSGTKDARITVTAYGIGTRPWIRDPNGGPYGTPVDLWGSFITIDRLGARDATTAGVTFEHPTHDNLVTRSRMTNTGYGVFLHGHHNRAIGNRVYNLKMIRNTPGGNDDYGAVGFVIDGTNNEVAWNTCTHCIAPSLDYGTDGGFVEVWRNGSGTLVHHNRAFDTAGFFELGADDPSYRADHVRVYYNLIENTHGAININRGDTYRIGVTDFRFENNTVIQNGCYEQLIYPDATPADFILRNNIFSLSGYQLWIYRSDSGRITHDHNLYELRNDANLGISLHAAERVANPRFVSRAERDYHLRSTSPAVNAGVRLGYLKDLDAAPVSSSRPDLGASER